MSRIKRKFEELKSENKKALIAFVTAGDPTFTKSKAVLKEIIKGGADIIELGIPFSDPMADGPTIQLSSERAIKGGTNLKKVLELLADLRKYSDIPIVLFGYYNPIFHYGLKKFAKDAQKAGADGVLIVDLPPEESGELETELEGKDIDLIRLITPTTGDKRMSSIGRNASGFVYYVSVTGVTGARKSVGKSLSASLKNVKNNIKTVPVGVGFGISTPEQARVASKSADGVVVGSAIINVISKNLKNNAMPKKVGQFVSSLKKAMV